MGWTVLGAIASWPLVFWTGMNTIAMFVLAGLAIVGGVLAYKNITVLREQHRRNTFLTLLHELAEGRERDNRAKIHEYIKREASGSPSEHARYVEAWIEHGRRGERGSVRLKDAIEETIGCLDRVGFFLMRGDPLLRVEAPVWIWTITHEMWEKLGDYVKLRQTTHYGYGQYFEKLADEAKKHPVTPS